MSIPQVQHRTKGRCTVLNEYTTYLYLQASDGSKFEAVPSEIIETFSATTPVNITPRATAEPSPSQIQVNVNDTTLKATDLSELVRGIGRVIAKGIIDNRPVDGYTSIDNLVEVLTAANVNFNQSTIDAIKADGSLVFGNVITA